jgi:DNA mismatch endonuclease (patch repair protein)
MVKKGNIPWNYHKKTGPLSNEIRLKMSKSHIGLKHTEEEKIKIGLSNTGKKHSEDRRRKNSESHKGLFVGEKNPFYGMKHTDETRKKISEKMKGKPNYWKGKKRGPMSEEIKRKIGSFFKGKPKSLESNMKNSNSHLGEKNCFYGKKHDAKAKIKMSEKGKGRKHTKEWIEASKVRRLKIIIPLKDTKPEKMLQEELKKRGYIYEKHYPIKGQPDIAFPDKKIAIFADGDYHHGNPDKYKSTDKICCGKYIAEEKWSMDKRVTEILQNQGWLVLRYWESEIKASVENVVDEIEDILLVRWKVD